MWTERELSSLKKVTSYFIDVKEIMNQKYFKDCFKKYSFTISI